MMKKQGMSDMEKFLSDEEFSVEVERELWSGYEQWLDEQADIYEYERSLWM